MLLVCTVVSASSAATPSWYPQLKIAVIDARHSGVEIGACVAPAAGKPKAGRACVLPLASEESGVFDRVSVYAETGEYVGPCKRLLFALDHTTVAAAQRALDFATHPGMTMAQDVSGRRALVRAATQVNAEFAALQHCLGKA